MIKIVSERCNSYYVEVEEEVNWLMQFASIFRSPIIFQFIFGPLSVVVMLVLPEL